MKFDVRFLMLLTLPALSGCGITDWADNHMPVIGQRCLNWQCFTESGQQQSHLAEQEQRMHPHDNPNTTGMTSDHPAVTPPTPGSPAAPQTPLAPPAGEAGAYKYVPRQAPPPGSTPFEGNITPASP